MRREQESGRAGSKPTRAESGSACPRERFGREGKPRARAIMPVETKRDAATGYYLVSRWRTVALAHMVEFTDIDPPKSASPRKRAS